MAEYNFDALDDALEKAKMLGPFCIGKHNNLFKQIQYIQSDARIWEYCYKKGIKENDYANFLVGSDGNTSSGQFYMSCDDFNNKFIPWLEAAIIEAKNVEKGNQKLGDDIPLFPMDLDEESFNPSPSISFNFDDKQKSDVKLSLKKVGFTDEEIEKIINGEVEVDKIKLDELCSDLEKAYKSDSSIRKLILEKYGIDVFNDDGTVIRDLAAIVLIMDGKNPDDDFDVKKLIADLTKPNETPVVDENKETNSEEENVDSQETTNNDKEAEISSDTTTHSGNSVSSTTLSDETITGTDEYKEAVNEIQDIIYDDNSSDVDLTDASDNIKRGVTSVLRGKIPSVINPSEHQESTSVKSATTGVGSAFAGLATAAAISGGGITAVKKHENKEENKEEKTNHVNENTASTTSTNEVKDETISTRPKWLDELDI